MDPWSEGSHDFLSSTPGTSRSDSHVQSWSTSFVFIGFSEVLRAKPVQHCPVPILVLKESGNQFLDPHQTRPICILVPLDGSPLAEEALQPALQFLTALTTSEAGRDPPRTHRSRNLPSIAGKPLLRAYELKHEQEQAVQKAEGYLKKIARRLCEADTSRCSTNQLFSLS